jgi:hypothetical protein
MFIECHRSQVDFHCRTMKFIRCLSISILIKFYQNQTKIPIRYGKEHNARHRINSFLYSISSVKLQAFIFTSNSYRIQSVFQRVNHMHRLRREVALLYGKVQTDDVIYSYSYMFIKRLDEQFRASFSNTCR